MDLEEEEEKKDEIDNYLILNPNDFASTVEKLLSTPPESAITVSVLSYASRSMFSCM